MSYNGFRVLGAFNISSIGVIRHFIDCASHLEHFLVRLLKEEKYSLEGDYWMVFFRGFYGDWEYLQHKRSSTPFSPYRLSTWNDNRSDLVGEDYSSYKVDLH